MASSEIYEVRLSEAERDALFAQLDAAAAYLGADKPAKLPIPNGDGTWDVGCTLEGDEDRLREALSLIYLKVPIP